MEEVLRGKSGPVEKEGAEGRTDAATPPSAPPILPRIESPADIRPLGREELHRLCGEIREYIVDVVSEKGGHLGASLGVVELTVALSRSLDMPNDRVVWDTAPAGHKEEKSSRDLWPHLNGAREFLQAPAEADPGKLAALEQVLTAHVNTYPKTRAAVYSRYYLGSIAFLLGQHDRSAAQFRDGIATGKAAGVMEYLLRDGVARALEAKGDFAGAASAYREAAGFAGADMKAQSLLGEARCLALAGRKPEAVALYRQILSDNPESKARTLIEIQLAQME